MASAPIQPPQPHEPTSKDALDQALVRLADKKAAWPQKSIAERLRILKQLAARVQEHAQEWAEVMHGSRGVQKGTPDAGEDWFYGPMVTARAIRLLIRALEAGGQPKPSRLYQRADGRWVAEVMPSDLWDKLLFPGFHVEQWMEPGKPPSQGRIYREKSSHARLCLVLGAGNVIGIPSTDVLHKLFVENEVCIVKLNPVNEMGGAALEQIFMPLVDEGFLFFAYGGVEVGKHLTDHKLVETIHITGSNITHDHIVWGSGADQEKNKKAKTPRLEKEISSELGCVTPFIVVPGDWSEAELAHQARGIAGAVQNNMSFMCVSPKVLVLHKEWPLRERFMEHVARALGNVPPRTAYYPGAHDRYQKFLDKYPQAKVVGGTAEGAVPWTLIPDVPPQKGEHALTAEAFCGVLAETSLSAGNAEGFLDKAVRFVNDEVWGNLSCTVIVDDKFAKSHARAVDQAIADLRYGNIGINAWAGANFTLMLNSFGAHPGNALEDIQSGRGFVHNCMLFDHPQKAVLRLPFRWLLTVPWAANHAGFGLLAERLTRFEGAPSLLKVPGVARAAIMG
jgi:acyl-CoA reductase-like NAD-dependent aldehyde dehydrogenase